MWVPSPPTALLTCFYSSFSRCNLEVVLRWCRDAPCWIRTKLLKYIFDGALAESLILKAYNMCRQTCSVLRSSQADLQWSGSPPQIYCCVCMACAMDNASAPCTMHNSCNIECWLCTGWVCRGLLCWACPPNFWPIWGMEQWKVQCIPWGSSCSYYLRSSALLVIPTPACPISTLLGHFLSFTYYRSNSLQSCAHIYLTSACSLKSIGSARSVYASFQRLEGVVMLCSQS